MTRTVNKTPFELRSDALSMAKDYFDQVYQTNKEYAEKIIQLNKGTMEEIIKIQPIPYKVDDVINMAKEFYKFIDTK